MKPTSSLLLKPAAIIGLVLIAYFLILKFSGLGLTLEYRIIEFVILGIGIHLGLKRMRVLDPSHFSYLRGILSGVFIGMAACFIFAFFLWAYLLFMDKAFMQELRDFAPFGPHLNPYIIATSLIAEGAAAGALFAFISMNSFKGLHEEV
jgi:hypothetical protein